MSVTKYSEVMTLQLIFALCIKSDIKKKSIQKLFQVTQVKQISGTLVLDNEKGNMENNLQWQDITSRIEWSSRY